VAIPIGLSLVGPIADSAGVRATLAGGAIVFVVTQASALLSRDFRTLRRREPQPEPESSAIASV
jgi:hypothetical protein